MIPPGATLGLMGGGQLGRMFTQAAQRMGYEVVVLDPDPVSPAGRIAARHLQASYTDRQALTTLGSLAQVVTIEFENVPAEALAFLRHRCPVRPGPEAVEAARILKRRLASVDRGDPGVPARTVLSDVRKRLGVPRKRPS